MTINEEDDQQQKKFLQYSDFPFVIWVRNLQCSDMTFQLKIKTKILHKNYDKIYQLTCEYDRYYGALNYFLALEMQREIMEIVGVPTGNNYYIELTYNFTAEAR